MPAGGGLSAHACLSAGRGLSAGSAVLSAGSAVLSAIAGRLRSSQQLLRADVLPVAERAGTIHSRTVRRDRNFFFSHRHALVVPNFAPAAHSDWVAA
jgi:hypothetical protein